MSIDLHIRDVRPDECDALGRLLIDVYSSLEGFPTPAQQPQYYQLFANIGDFVDRPAARVLVAVTSRAELVGGVVYFGDMVHYGSGGSATSVKDASGMRLLGVSPRHRNTGAGKALINACVRMARQKGHAQLILHTTQAMHTARRLYEKLGFVRFEDLDFLQQGLPIFGFRLALKCAGRKPPPMTMPSAGPSDSPAPPCGAKEPA